MAPPERSRRKRHGKSPRHKRFGSGKSTPSSPAGTPRTRSLSKSTATEAGGTSGELCSESAVEVISKDSPLTAQTHPISSSQLLELSLASTSSSGCSSCSHQKGINGLSESLAVDKKVTTMSSTGLNKLDHLCGLLDNIVIQHKNSIPPSNKSIISPMKKQAQKEQIDVPKAQTSTSDVSDHSKEKSREEVELERNMRKEAKKAKKKGNNKENEKDDGDSAKEGKKVDNNKASMQKIQKSSVAVEVQKGNKETPKEQQSADQQSTEGDESGKSKADLKRERREKQEAQRKAKMEAKAQQEAEKKQKQQPQQSNKEKAVAQQPKKKTEADGKRVRDKRSSDKDHSERRIPLLDHLMAHVSQPPSHPVNCDSIHSAVRTLGIKMKERVIDGSTARVISMLAAFKRVISDYQTPEACDLSRDLAEKLVPNVAFLRACRLQNIAMDNAVRFLKHEINSIKPDEPEAQAKDQLRTAIDEYIRNNIILASSTIASHASQVVNDGDVILTYGYSALVSDVVEAASNRGDKISVVVADTPHPASGAAMVKRLAALGITTYYRLITEVSHIINKVTKVIVEAEAVMMNGAVQGLCGMAGLALAAANHDTPFIVLCHTYKFCNNDLTDSLVINELGDADSMVSCPSSSYCNLLSGWRETPNLNVVSLVYDVTPANLVTALITEQNVLPTSAVPVIIRRNYADILGQD